MALTRKFLSALGVEQAQADEIIEAHTSTVTGVKAELEEYKAKSEELEKTQKQLEKVQKELDKLKADSENQNADEFKNKYNDLKKEYDEYKASVKEKETKEIKAKAFKELLKEAKISEKRFDAIVKLSDDEINKLEFDEDGTSIKDKENVLKAITDNWSEFVQTTEVEGAGVSNPPKNTGGDDKKISRAKQIAQQYHDDMYGKIKKED